MSEAKTYEAAIPRDRCFEQGVGAGQGTGVTEIHQEEGSEEGAVRIPEPPPEKGVHAHETRVEITPEVEHRPAGGVVVDRAESRMGPDVPEGYSVVARLKHREIESPVKDLRARRADRTIERGRASTDVHGDQATVADQVHAVLRRRAVDPEHIVNREVDVGDGLQLESDIQRRVRVHDVAELREAGLSVERQDRAEDHGGKIESEKHDRLQS